MEPNRLRDEATPNTYRTGRLPDSPGVGSRRAGAPGDTGRPAPSGQPRFRPRWRPSRGTVIGAVIAIAGVPLFFMPGIDPAVAGLGLMSTGTGITLIVAMRRRAREVREHLGRGGWSVVGELLLAPHLLVGAIAGPGLIAFGLLCLLVQIDG